MIRLLRRLAPIALVVVSAAFILSGPLRGATHDEEEYRNAILGTVLHARAVVDGVYPYWTSSLGFGIPLAFNPAILLHPLMPLFGVFEPDAVVRLLYVVHTALGAAGIWLLVCYLGAGPWAAALGASTWVLSAPSQNYMLTDLWVAEFVAWSLAPYLVLFAIRVVESSDDRQPWVDALAFGLVSGLIVANGHAGYVPVFFVPLAVMFAADWRRVRRAWPALALAVCVGLAIAGPTLGRLLVEVARFPDVKTRSISENLVRAPELLDLLVRPLSLASPAGMLQHVFQRGTRVPFFGGPMFLLALACVAGFGAVPYRRPLVLGFASAFLLMLLPGYEWLSAFAATYLFRDPMILFGIVLGCLAWQALLMRRAAAAWIVAAAQVMVLTAAAWPFVDQAAHDSRWIADASLRQSPLTAALRRWVERLPGRWYLAPEADALIRNQRFFRDGLWINVWPYRGLPVVNGAFKGVSADPMFPSQYLPYGRIDGHAATVASAATLDVLGIGAVLATVSEPVAPALEEVARFSNANGVELRLMRNPGAWPGAAFVDDAVVTTALQPLDGCDIGGTLCLDFAPVASAPHESQVRLSRRHGDLRVRFPGETSGPRWLLVSEMYRPGWQARAGHSNLPVTPMFDGLIGVRVPAGVDEVALRYRPAVLVLLTWASFSALALVIMVLAVVGAARRTPLSRYLSRLLARYVGYHLPPDARVVEFSPRTPALFESLSRPSMQVAFPSPPLAGFPEPALSGWTELEVFRPDRIILNGTFHHERDIQALLDRLRQVCQPDTRILALYYSTVWKPILAVGWRLGLTTTRPDHNWIAPSDVENLFRLTGFEVITTSQHVLVPVHIPVIGGLINRWLAPLPVLRWFTLVNLAVVRVAPSGPREPASVSVVVPARNERGNIAAIVERIPAMGPADEIIFVEGHSSDGTWEEIQAVMARHPDRRIRAFQQQGRGKGDAVRTGFAAAAGGILMILDADLTVPPEELPKFYRAISTGLGDFINGSRLVYPMDQEAMRFANMVGNKFFALAFSYLLGQPLKDTLCGTKVLSREHYERIARGRLYFGDFDPFGDFDLLFGAAKLGLRIVELPIRYRERTYGTTNIRRWSHGLLLLRMTAFAARKMKFI